MSLELQTAAHVDVLKIRDQKVFEITVKRQFCGTFGDKSHFLCDLQGGNILGTQSNNRGAGKVKRVGICRCEHRSNLARLAFDFYDKVDKVINKRQKKSDG